MKRRRPPIGSRPGTLAIPEGAPAPRIDVIDYSADVVREAEITDPYDLRRYLASDETAWVNVRGFGDEQKLWEVAEVFGLHALTLESATNIPQRANVELSADHLKFVARIPCIEADGTLDTPQVCFIVGANWLLTFQDHQLGLFDPVRARIREGLGPIRQQGPDYLFYALLDTLVDRYFPVVEDIAKQLEDIEEALNRNPDPKLLKQLHRLRRDLVAIRRVGQPQLEALRGLNLNHEPFIREDAAVYLRSTEQHLSQGMGIVESSRDLASNLVDLYLSAVGQRTNEVMMVLTLMASIFIPLTFIAGIYGMNFEAMPELRKPWGYPTALAAMGAVAAGMIVWFRRRGWIGRARSGDGED